MPAQNTERDSLLLDTGCYQVQTVEIDGQTVCFRLFEGLVYVRNPVDPVCHRMNLYVPEGYFRGENIHGFTAGTAPIFLPNSVGGYMPGEVEYPGPGRENRAINSIFAALTHGCVVASPGVRGRITRDETGRYTGKAPACIVDLKAAVRYLRHNSGRIPGDTEKIITNGTSAGGALSALLGATGNHADYEPYLKALGAAEERDDVFASSCYCPVTNLNHFDAAHEWQFCGINDYVTGHEDVRTGTLNEEERRYSAELKAQFTAYVNSLGLKGPDGTALTLDQEGNGPFRDYVVGCVAASAQRELDRGAALTNIPWLRVEGRRVMPVDLFGLAKEGGRIKLAPGFDHLEMDSPENELFGTETQNARHFTTFSRTRSRVGGALAGEREIHLMNPMDYIGTPGCTAARHWRIRHGTKDSALAIQTLLALKLRNAGFEVDFSMPWELRHDGDYDLDELFDWVQRICQEEPAR